MSFLLNFSNAAKYLHISEETLWRITNVEKKIKGYSLGSSVKYSIEELNCYLNAQARGNPVKYAQESLNEDIDEKGVMVNISS